MHKIQVAAVLMMMMLGHSFDHHVLILVDAADPDPLFDFTQNPNLTSFTLRDMINNGDVSHGPGGTRAGLNISLYPAMDFDHHVLILVDAADPDPLFDFTQNPNLTSFTLRDMINNGDVSHGPGGTRAGLNISLYPAMESQGLTYVRFQMKPCGINLPHTHPRASEMLTLLEGGPLQVGFVDTAGVAHVDIMNKGDVTIFPRGLLHYELNVGDKTAHFLSALDSQNPGTLTAATSLFQLPVRALAASLNQRVTDVLAIKATLFENGHALQMSTIAGCVPGKNIVNNF